MARLQTDEDHERVQGDILEAMRELTLVEIEEDVAMRAIKYAILQILEVESVQRKMVEAMPDKPQDVLEMYSARSKVREAILNILEIAEVFKPVQDEILSVEEICMIKRKIIEVLQHRSLEDEEQARAKKKPDEIRKVRYPNDPENYNIIRDVRIPMRKILKIRNGHMKINEYLRIKYEKEPEDVWVPREIEEATREVFQKFNARKEIKAAMQEILKCEMVKRKMDDENLDDSQRDREYHRIRREINESMQPMTFRNEQEQEGVEKDIQDVMRGVAQNSQEEETVSKEINEAMQTCIKKDKEPQGVQEETTEDKLHKAFILWLLGIAEWPFTG